MVWKAVEIGSMLVGAVATVVCSFAGAKTSDQKMKEEIAKQIKEQIAKK